MYNKPASNIAIGAVIGSILIAILLTVVIQARTAKAGNAGTDDPVSQYATSSKVWVGKDVTTVPVASFSVGRTYLEISNISTSTPGAVFCNVGRTAALAAPTAYSGIMINASSTRIWGRDQSVPIGFVRCIAPSASTTVTVVEK